jgi:hypothetical protein
MIKLYYRSEQEKWSLRTFTEVRRGKSELYRARRSLMRSGGNPKESATERETVPAFAGIRVKR